MQQYSNQSNWTEVAALYQKKLRDVLSVYRFTMDLADLPQVEVEEKTKELLNAKAAPLQRQFDRLEKNEFRIAVVGLEKAGKSTFVNAWLENDLLPAAAARCTYTTTQVYSVSDENEQRLEVIPKTREEFAVIESELRRKFEKKEDEAHKRAEEDLNTIEKCRADLYKVMADGKMELSFSRLDEIKPPLKKYVADKRYAHAVKEVRLYTKDLAATGGVMFYDVPGLNSGLEMHMEQSERMLLDCDAVICIKQHATPSLEASEQKLVEFAKKGETEIELGEKLFVFLGRLDNEGSEKSIKDNFNAAAQQWYEKGKVARDHIVGGSAGAFLVLTGAAQQHTRDEVGSHEIVRAKLSSLTGKKEESELVVATGVQAIKERIQKYLECERGDILRKKCDGPIKEIMDCAQKIHEQVSQCFPDDPDQAKREEANRQRDDFFKWWERHFIKVKGNFANYYEKEIGPDTTSPIYLDHEAVNKFRERYTFEVRNGFQLLYSRQDEFRQDLLDSHKIPAWDPAKANYAWRKHLYTDVMNMMSGTAGTLADELFAETESLVVKMSDLLWGSKAVRKNLLGKEGEYKVQLHHSLLALFLRFARPIAEVLVQTPINSEMRRKMVDNLGVDMDTIDNYYQGNKQEYRTLKKFINYGGKVFTDKGIRRDILGIAEIVGVPGAKLVSKVNAFLDATTQAVTSSDESSVDDLIYEVETDLNALEEYLVEAVFGAAGFGAFRDQELRSLRDRFVAKDWGGFVQSEYVNGNQRLLADMPPNLQVQEFNMEVADHLRQLNIALVEAKRIAI